MIHKFDTSKHEAMQTMKGIATGDRTDLNLICPRAINKYRYNHDDFQSLINSIKNNGLFSAITINSIDKYLKSPDSKNLSKEELDYYNYQLENGRQYFVSDGNRRFYAYCSLCVNKNITSIEQMDEFYKLYEIEKENNKDSMLDFNFTSTNKYLSIKANVVKDNFWKERKRYNSANLDQRAVIDFEIVDNAIDNMKAEVVKDDNGNEISLWDYELNKIKVKIIDSMKDRAVFDLVDRIKNNNDSMQIIKSYSNGTNLVKNLNSLKDVKEARDILKKLPIEVLPKHKQEQVAVIKQYISTRFSKELSSNNINKCRLILSTYPSSLTKLIYSGDLPFREAKMLLPVYKYLPNDFALELPEILKEKENYSLEDSTLSDESKAFYKEVVIKGKFCIDKAKKALLNKEEQYKAVLNQEDLIDLIKDIKYGRKTVDEVYDYLKSLNLV